MLLLAVVHWLLNPALVLVCCRALFGRLGALSFPNVFLATYFLFIYVRALEIHLQRAPPQTFLISVWVVPYLVVFSAGFVLLAGRHGSGGISRAFLHGATPSQSDHRITGLLKAVSIAFILLPAIYVLDIGVSNIGLLYLLRNPGRAIEAMNLRIGGLSSNYSPLLTALYSYGRALLYPLYIAILGAYWGRKMVSTRHFFVVLVAGALFVSFTGAKAPIAILLASGLVAVYFARQGRISSVAFVSAAGTILFLPALVYPLLYGVSGWSALGVAAENLWRRVTLVPSSVSAAYFNAFEYRFEHLGARSNRFLAYLTNQEYEPAARLMYERYADGSIQGGLINASFFASFFADWGIGGVVVGSVFVGLCLGVLQVFYDKFQNDLLGTGFRAVNLLAVTQLILTNFYSAALGRGLLSLPILLIVTRVAVQSWPRRSGATLRSPLHAAPSNGSEVVRAHAHGR